MAKKSTKVETVERKPSEAAAGNMSGQERAVMVKEYGEVFFDGERLVATEGKIIPTTLGLDIALSGGVRQGVITNIAGLPKCGKSTLCLTIIAMAQRLGIRCIYMDVEARLSTSLLKCIEGLVWTKEQEKETGIPALEIIKPAPGNLLSAEKYLNIAKKYFLKYPGCLIVMDSIAMMMPEDALSGEIGDKNKVMGIPTLMYQFFRQVTQIINSNNCSLITITHLQSSPSPYKPVVEVGGNAVQFMSSNRLVCMSSKEYPDEGPKLGRESKFKITASALGSPAGEAIIYIRYGKGCDREKELCEVAVEMGVIEKTGGWYKLTVGDLEEKIQGQDNVIEFLRANKDIANQLEADIRKNVLGTTE